MRRYRLRPIWGAIAAAGLTGPMPPYDELLTNATLVLPDQVMHGSLLIRDGRIAELQDGSAGTGTDFAGDLLIPGLIDLHTDNLERQVQPRSNARWPSASAFLTHDAQCAVAGITTVLDALCVGDLGYEPGRTLTLQNGLRDGAALSAAGRLRVRHAMHLRCELPASNLQSLLHEAIGQNASLPDLRMVSLMDHTPGFGQHANLAPFRRLRRMDGMEEPQIERLIAELHAQRGEWRERNLAHLLATVGSLPRPPLLASHDDRTEQEVAAFHALGVRVSEFPVSRQAASAARALGMQIIGGAPNLVRGGSHSGNVSVRDLLDEGLLDALASDYVPASLVESIFLHDTLQEGVARVTARPAAMAGFADRGRLAPGLLADLVRVRPPADGLPPCVVAVWRGGERVA